MGKEICYSREVPAGRAEPQAGRGARCVGARVLLATAEAELSPPPRAAPRLCWEPAPGPRLTSAAPSLPTGAGAHAEASPAVEGGFATKREPSQTLQVSVTKTRGALTQTRAQNLTLGPYFCYGSTGEAIGEGSALLSAALRGARARRAALPPREHLQTAQLSVRPAAALNMRHWEIRPQFPLVRSVGTSPAAADLSFHLEAIKRNKAKQKIKPRTRETSLK